MEEKLVVFNKYGSPVDANIIKGALEAAGIPAGVIGDNFANNFWKDSFRVVVFRKDLEEAIKVIYGSEMNYEDYQEEMDIAAFEKMRDCNMLFGELALKIHPELSDEKTQDLYAKARLAMEENDLATLNKIKQALE